MADVIFFSVLVQAQDEISTVRMGHRKAHALVVLLVDGYSFLVKWHSPIKMQFCFVVARQTPLFYSCPCTAGHPKSERFASPDGVHISPLFSLVFF